MRNYDDTSLLKGSVLYRMVNLDLRKDYFMEAKMPEGGQMLLPITNSEIVRLEKFT